MPNPFYRYQGQIITLQPDFSAFVVFNSNTIRGGGKTIIDNQLSNDPAIKSVRDLTPNSLLVEVKPNTSSTAIESAKQNLRIASGTLQIGTAYTSQSERVYSTNQIIISLKPNTSITQVNTLFFSS